MGLDDTAGEAPPAGGAGENGDDKSEAEKVARDILGEIADTLLDEVRDKLIENILERTGATVFKRLIGPVGFVLDVLEPSPIGLDWDEQHIQSLHDNRREPGDPPKSCNGWCYCYAGITWNYTVSDPQGETVASASVHKGYDVPGPVPAANESECKDEICRPRWERVRAHQQRAADKEAEKANSSGSGEAKKGGSNSLSITVLLSSRTARYEED